MKLRTSKYSTLLNVLIVFIGVVIIFNLAKGLTAGWSIPVQGFPIPYISIGTVILLYAATKERALHCLGILPGERKTEIRLLSIALLPTFLIKASLYFIDWKYVPGALLVSMIIFISTLIVARGSRDLDLQEATPLILGVLFIAQIPNRPLYGLHEWSLLGYRLLYTGFVALVEEMVFRGAIYFQLAKVFEREWKLFDIQFNVALITSSILFGLWHLINGLLVGAGVTFSLGWGLWTLVLGVFLGLMRMKTRRILMPTVLHWIINV